MRKRKNPPTQRHLDRNRHKMKDGTILAGSIVAQIKDGKPKATWSLDGREVTLFTAVLHVNEYIKRIHTNIRGMLDQSVWLRNWVAEARRQRGIETKKKAAHAKKAQS